MSCTENKNCNTCMAGAPYSYCCKSECGEHEFCRNCDYTNPSKNNTKPTAETHN